MIPIRALAHLSLSAALMLPAATAAVEVETTTYEDIRVLTISGEFTPYDDPDSLARALVSFAPDVVTFNSPGGSIYPAMEFGRTIRRFGASTLQFRGMECASACALAFFGGVERFAEPGSIGMHKTSFVDEDTLSAGDAVSAVQSSTADVLAYLIEMGVDPGLLQLALRYESWDIRYLSGSEMADHRVTTGEPQTAARQPRATETPMARQPPASERADRLTAVQDARSGQVRRPKGYAAIMAEPSTDASEIRVLQNGEAVAILGTNDRWYRVRSGDYLGWMHHTWVKVDQFYDAGFEAKHVQIKSFDNGAAAEEYLRSSGMPLDAFIATNGWLAVTLDGTFTDPDAENILRSMKAGGRIPSDSYQTFGNTYMQKLCCD